MTYEPTQQFSLKQVDSHWVIAFKAMASPCEILVPCTSASEAHELALLAHAETSRIEQKFSRYLPDNVVFAINHSNGEPVNIDDETFHLLSYAGECHALSEGLFDITSGILRRAWNFNGQEVQPDKKLIASLLRLVGWDKTRLDGASFSLLPGMEIDLGGLGKEYAVDRVAQILYKASNRPLMVNFGGDIRAISPASVYRPWKVGIEDPEQTSRSLGAIDLANGAIATSGLSYRHCYVNGKRLGHILNPQTGWPVEDAPRSVTVLAGFCTEAGLLSTMAMLQGKGAETFLAAQQVKYHCIR